MKIGTLVLIVMALCCPAAFANASTSFALPISQTPVAFNDFYTWDGFKEGCPVQVAEGDECGDSNNDGICDDHGGQD